MTGARSVPACSRCFFELRTLSTGVFRSSAVHKRRLAWLVYRVTGSLFEGTSGYDAWRSYQALELPSSDRPLVSIVIPTYGQFAHTVACLRSIMKHPPAVPFELLVIEDHSGDGTIGALAAVPGRPL